MKEWSCEKERKKEDEMNRHVRKKEKKERNKEGKNARMKEKTMYQRIDLRWRDLKERKKQEIYIRGSWNKFPDFFRMGSFIDSTRMKL